MPGRRILVVEDEVLIRMLAVDMLGDEGYECDEAGNGAEALGRLQAPDADYAVVFLDIGLPDMRGDDLIPLVRQLRPAIPLLVASGEDTVELKRRLGSHLPIAFLGKPYDLARLRQTMLSLLGPAPA